MWTGQECKNTIFFPSLSLDSPVKSLSISSKGIKSLLSALELLQYNWIVCGLHMIQQELSAQLSLTVLRCGSWHMPHGPASMGLSLGQVLPARQSQDRVQDSCCQTSWC